MLGILVMNIAAFGLPFGTYDDPRIWGGATGTDAVVWAVAYAAADGKMRALFTMLFGASLLIVADSAATSGANPAVVHYRRMAVLLGIGIVHGYGIWYGDILLEYALAGAILFVAWQWRPAALFYAAAATYVATIAYAAIDLSDTIALRDAAASPTATAAIRTAWSALANPDATAALKQIAGYRGGFTDVMATRLADLAVLQQGLPIYLIEALGTAAFGMGLYRAGYFSGWPMTRHRMIMALGIGIALPIGGGVAAMIVAAGYDPVTTALGTLLTVLIRPLLVIGYASAIILLVNSGRLRWLADRLAAAGQMALSNYLATSIVMTTIFYGYGLGWFAQLSRAQLYLPMLGMWAAILLWSRPWLRRYRFGPVEWVWRSLARGQWQSMRR